jgi:serine O-acetyltransferase/putative colanic acid biosynthesis acetyltransferase WcaB
MPKPFFRDLLAVISDDFSANRGYPKSQFVLILFRLASCMRSPRERKPRFGAYIIGIFYRIVVEWVMGIEIPWRTRIGAGLVLYHGVGIVVHEEAVLGRGVKIRHGVTIGNNGSSDEAPKIGNGVDIGAGACILGGVIVGDGARIGANAVVIRDVPPGATVVGIPARII